LLGVAPDKTIKTINFAFPRKLSCFFLRIIIKVNVLAIKEDASIQLFQFNLST